MSSWVGETKELAEGEQDSCGHRDFTEVQKYFMPSGPSWGGTDAAASQKMSAEALKRVLQEHAFHFYK